VWPPNPRPLGVAARHLRPPPLASHSLACLFSSYLFLIKKEFIYLFFNNFFIKMDMCHHLIGDMWC
jgi:hypothetical protein